MGHSNGVFFLYSSADVRSHAPASTLRNVPLSDGALSTNSRPQCNAEKAPLIWSGWVHVGSSMMSLFISLVLLNLWQVASWPHALDFLTWSIISTYFCCNRDFTFQLLMLCKYRASCVQSSHDCSFSLWENCKSSILFPSLRSVRLTPANQNAGMHAHSLKCQLVPD